MFDLLYSTLSNAQRPSQLWSHTLSFYIMRARDVFLRVQLQQREVKTHLHSVIILSGNGDFKGQKQSFASFYLGSECTIYSS